MWFTVTACSAKPHPQCVTVDCSPRISASFNDPTKHDHARSCNSIKFFDCLVLNIFKEQNWYIYWYFLLTMGFTIRNMFVWGFLKICMVAGERTVFLAPGSLYQTYIKVCYGSYVTCQSVCRCTDRWWVAVGRSWVPDTSVDDIKLGVGGHHPGRRSHQLHTRRPSAPRSDQSEA
jgi:hypothetical protein